MTNEKECGLPSNFDMPRPFTPCKTEFQPTKLPNGLLYPRVEVEQRTHSGYDIDSTHVLLLENTEASTLVRCSTRTTAVELGP